MENNSDEALLLDKVIASALHEAFSKAVERAKQTRTYLVFEREGKIERIPYDKIDSFIARISHLDLRATGITVRRSETCDIESMVSLSRAKRLDYEKTQPQFWRYAGETGDNSQKCWFKELLSNNDYLMYVAEDENRGVLGFIIGQLVSHPMVYHPGGLTLMIDDFCVQSIDLWDTVGAQLIETVKMNAKSRGAVQILVVCGHHDHLKRNFLMSQNLSIASEWLVGGME